MSVPAMFAEWSDLVERSDGDRFEIRKSERSVRPAPTVAHSVPRPREWFAVYLPRSKP